MLVAEEEEALLLLVQVAQAVEVLEVKAQDLLMELLIQVVEVVAQLELQLDITVVQAVQA
jgi:hypothetical protein